MNKKCICLITHKPNEIWLNFLNTFTLYDIYVVADDNEINYQHRYETYYPNITFIQIENQKCVDSGYVNVNYLMRKSVTGWEKALYYFSKTNNNYVNVWFIEDDVFFHSEKTIVHVDLKYADSDILAPSCIARKDSKSWFHWKNITINFSPPYFMSMVCATRMSKQLLSHINNYASTHGTLFFLEALFPTLAIKHQLVYNCPEELRTIVWRRQWQEKEVTSKNIYHPEKNIELHQHHRNRLA